MRGYRLIYLVSVFGISSWNEERRSTTVTAGIAHGNVLTQKLDQNICVATSPFWSFTRKIDDEVYGLIADL
ncbi:hypothetical protein M407DRAFT_112100 [Tulasnella calospora MUT 4182]|uniref:Uncharacterized protein n=1 Tax=Tulasnella calospora MUT 4182 TaxID=1051891 RepID=A0A0C3QJ60_9AGAM|nr:hypothetical protein M407DRAFT_112100 [Tulasnella calospora MUT 4182]